MKEEEYKPKVESETGSSLLGCFVFDGGGGG